jgi:hypothetical protein
VGHEAPHLLEGQFGPPGPPAPKIDEIKIDVNLNNKLKTSLARQSINQFAR